MHGLRLAASASSGPGRRARRAVAVVVTSVLVAAGIPMLAQPAYAGTSDFTVVFDDTASANAVPAGVLTVDVSVDGTPTACTTTGCAVVADLDQLVSASVTIDNQEWVFAGWGPAPVCDEGTQTQTSCSWTAAGPVTLTAKVTPRNLSTVTITAPTHGTVDLSQFTSDGYFVSITCPGTCTTKVDRAETFSLSATPAVGYDFAGWSVSSGTVSPACTSSDFCDTSATSSAVTIASSFTLTPTTAALTIARTPTAGGSVAVSTTSTLFTCGATCTGDVPLDTTFTLTATPTSGYRVTDWSGVFCDEFPVGNVCTVSGGISQGTTATVTFELTRTVTLSAGFTPSGGSATVDWETSGFDFGTCTFPGAACVIPVPDGQSVTLTPTGAPGTAFTSWSGVSCASASCTFTPSSNVSVTAAFTVVGTSVVTVKRTGGLGTVDVIGGDGFTVLTQCSAAALATVQGCTATVTNGQPVTLAASPDATTDGSRSVVASWTSCTQTGDEQAGAVCTITPSGNRTVTVAFDQVADGALTVNLVKAGGGALPNGALVSAFLDQAADIDCGTSTGGVPATACATKSRLHTGVSLFVDVPVGYTVSVTGCDLDEFLRCRLYLETASAVTITYTSVGTWTVTLTKTGWLTGEQLSASSPSSFVTCPNTADACPIVVTKGDPVFIFASTGAQDRKVTIAGGTLCTASNDTGSASCFGTPTAAVTVPVSWSANTTRLVSAAVLAGDEAGGGVSLPGNPSCSNADTCAARGLGVGRTVTVSAIAQPGWVFTSWTGCPVTTTSSNCTFTVVAGTQIDVKANFTNVGTWRVTVNAPSTVHGLVGLEGASCIPASEGGSVSCFVDVTKGSSAFVLSGAENGWTPVFAPACSALQAFTFCTVTPTADTTITVTFTDSPVSTVTFLATPAAAADLQVEWASTFFFPFACGSTCVVTVKPGTDILADAGSPSPGYVLKRWTGCDAQSGYRCEVTAPAAGTNTNVTADFLIKADTPLHRLTVVNTSSAEIDVDPMESDGFVGYDGSLECAAGDTCTVQVFEGQELTLSAFPAATWAVSGTGSSVVSGCSVGAGDCGVRVGTTDLTVTTTSANLLTVSRTGSGIVTSSPAGISCGVDCSAGFAPGAVVTLTAAPAAGWVFAGWSGACTGTATTCQVTMSAAKSVGARFAAISTLQAEGTTGVTKTWASVAASGTYGGSEWRSDSPGSSVSHTFTGTSISYFFSKTSSSGTAIVKVDGVTKATVNQYSSSTKLKQRVTITGLTNATHTISVTVSSTKPSGSKGTVVAVDAFARNSTSCGTGCAVTPTVVAAWARVSLSAASGGAYVQARTKGATLTWSFTGSSIVVYRVKGVDKGKLGVYLDGVLKGTLNDYATSTKVSATGTSFSGLPVKAHTLKIVVLGVLGSTSKPASLNVAVDRAVVTG